MRGRTLALCVLALLTAQPPRAPASLTVSAAVSLTEVIEEIAKAYARSGGGLVRFNFAASNVLARQIVNGAPVDVFISADEAQMDLVEKAGAIQGGSRIGLVGNQLAIVAAVDRAAFVRDNFTRAAPGIRRLALGDPAAVPAGVYARQYLEKQGLWKAYESRVVPTTSVRAALAAVETGGADAAIVYATDVGVARRAAVAFVVPVEQGPRIVYPAAVISKNVEAARLMTFLCTDEASVIFARHKFLTAGRCSG
jgi:molybdate transport system substrate-binding protein